MSYTYIVDKLFWLMSIAYYDLFEISTYALTYLILTQVIHIISRYEFSIPIFNTTFHIALLP